MNNDRMFYTDINGLDLIGHGFNVIISTEKDDNFNQIITLDNVNNIKSHHVSTPHLFKTKGTNINFIGLDISNDKYNLELDIDQLNIIGWMIAECKVIAEKDERIILNQLSDMIEGLG